MIRNIDLRFKAKNADKSVKINLDTEDDTNKHILYAIHLGVFFENELSVFMLRALDKGDVVVDVGANIGYFSLIAASVVGKNGKVLAVEANPQNADRIRDNIKLNNMECIDVIDKAAGRDFGDIKFWTPLSGNSNGGTWVYDCDPGAESGYKILNVPVTKLDHEVSSRTETIPKLIKIDTEGEEIGVLEGAKGLLDGAKVPFVVCELNYNGLRERGYNEFDLRNFMRKFGYDTFLLRDAEELPILVPEKTSILMPSVSNILFSTQEHIGKLYPTVFHKTIMDDLAKQYMEKQKGIQAGGETDPS